MPSPFPGMDPYLEDPAEWAGFRLTVLVAVAEAIARRLPPNYFADIDQFNWPDKEPPPKRKADVIARKLLKRPHKYVEVVDKANNRVVTVIEVLSPSNKSGEDRDGYLQTRAEYFAAKVNLVELDLLRDGERVPFDKPKPPPADYYALVCRGDRHPKAPVWGWTVRDPLPVLPIPLKPADGDIALEL